MDHSKGKPANTSVPSIAIRFNASAEEVEELYQSEDELEQTSNEQNKSAGDVESSPLRYLPRLGKRSGSSDNSLASLDSSPTSDRWKFFSDIKGKITKNIEDTITEIKQRNQEGDGTVKKAKDKENLSDSEDMSESSISKTCGAVSTTDGVEMSSDEDTPSLENDKTPELPPQPSHSFAAGVSKTSSNLRQRFKLIKKAKNGSNVKESSISVNALGKLLDLNAGVNPSSTSHDVNESVEVESGIEALEDINLQNDNMSSSSSIKARSVSKEILNNIVDKIDNLELDKDDIISFQAVSGTDIGNTYLDVLETPDVIETSHSYFAPEGFVDLRGTRLQYKTWYSTLYSCRRLLYVIASITLYHYIPLTVYLKGFVAGALFALALLNLYNTFVSLNTPSTGLINRPLLPQYAKSVFKVPPIKEHIPISSHEGWMNEYPEVYNPLTYHVSQTQSVYVKLQGNLMKISHTQAKIPKRAMWDEPKHKLVFTHHRIYNLLDAKIMLLPADLHRKKHWSKKYPICIMLNKNQLNFESIKECSPPEIMEPTKDASSSRDLNEKKQSKKKIKKKVSMEPQIFSKLAAESVEVESFSEKTELVAESDEALSDVQSLKLPDFFDEEDFLFADEEHLDDEITTADDWHTFTPLDSPDDTLLYLFARTGREKEEWFRRFVSATHKEDDTSREKTSTLDAHEHEKYLIFMAQFLKRLKGQKGDFINEEEYLRAINVLWVNSVIGRLLYDWSRDVGFNNIIKEKIQKKLSTIKLPYFIEQLTVCQLTIGDISPLIHNAYKPVLDQRGLWIDLDVNYQGSIVVVLQTKLNLMKLKRHRHASVDNAANIDPSTKWQTSDVEDTAESSTDDEKQLIPAKLLVENDASSSAARVSAVTNTTKSKKFERMVDKIAESKFFQVASENRYVKRALEGVSNTDLSLKVEVKGLIGTLVLNIPPPPTNRIWLGFRPAPQLFLTAQPIVGERNISFVGYLTNWIEKKLCKEFQKLLVIPNMEDFSLPGMPTELPK